MASWCVGPVALTVAQCLSVPVIVEPSVLEQTLGPVGEIVCEYNVHDGLWANAQLSQRKFTCSHIVYVSAYHKIDILRACAKEQVLASVGDFLKQFPKATFSCAIGQADTFPRESETVDRVFFKGLFFSHWLVVLYSRRANTLLPTEPKWCKG